MNEINVQAIKYGKWHVLLSIVTLCTSVFYLREIIFFGFVNAFAVI